jgi:ABC-2 type transport system permease protein
MSMLVRSLYIYSAYFAQFMKTRLAYRVDFIASLFANAAVAVSGLLFVLFLMDGQVVQSLRGWNREEVLFIYGYSMLSMSIFGCLSPNLFSFGDRYVIQGAFDRVLLRPLNSLCQVLFESFNTESLGSFAVGFCVLFYSAGKLQIKFSLADYGWLIVSSFSGAVILLSVFVFAAALSFYFEDRMGISGPLYNLVNFSRYPMPIFNSVIQFILRWVIPFAFVAFYPATYFFERTEFILFCYLTPVVALLSLCVAAAAWSFGVSRYCSVGN